MTDGENAELAAFRSGDTLFVNFAGASDDQLRILDCYDQRGRYPESWKLPFTGAVAYRDGYLFAVVNSQEAADLVALAPAADSSRILQAHPGSTVVRPARKGQSGR